MLILQVNTLWSCVVNNVCVVKGVCEKWCTVKGVCSKGSVCSKRAGIECVPGAGAVVPDAYLADR